MPDIPQFHEALALLIRARVALRAPSVTPDLTLDQAKHIIALSHDSVAEAIRLLRGDEQTRVQ